MIDQQQSENTVVRASSNVKSMQIDCLVAIDSREFLWRDPFDTIFETARATGIDDDHAIEQAATRGIEVIDPSAIRM